MKSLAILGASGHGKVVADAAELNDWGSIVFFDDAYPAITLNGKWPVQGTFEDMLAALNQFDAVFVAIGNNQIRLDKLKSLQQRGIPIATIIHPDACISRYAKLHEGSVVMAGAVVNSDAVIGMGGIINTQCSVDHDCVLGEAVHVSPGAHLAGAVQVGDGSWIGIGSSIKQLVRVGVGVTVGAGAAVIADVPDYATVVGVPARAI